MQASADHVLELLIRPLTLSLAAALLLCAIPALAFGQTPQHRIVGPANAAKLAAPVLDPYLDKTLARTVWISGSAPGGFQVEVISHHESHILPVVNGRFGARVPIGTNRRNRIFFTSLAAGQRSAPATATVIQDSLPPQVFIDVPSEDEQFATQFSPTQPRIDVSGRLRDHLTGFEGIDVTVNGIPALVDVGIGTNGTFYAPNVPINWDAQTTLLVTATDVLGNVETDSITVSHQSISSGTPLMVRAAGNSQTAQVGEWLQDPIEAFISDANGLPFVHKWVTFRVTRSDGRLAAAPTGDGAMLFQAQTDESGIAKAYWKLGNDAGRGNNRITATSTSILGTTIFSASANPGPPAQLNVGSGNSQRVEAGAPAPDPLRVFGSDGCNGIENLAVTFSVTQGDGLVNGLSEITVPTTLTGHAEVRFTAGGSQGNNRVQATFPANPTNPVVFVTYGVERVDQDPTSFSGIVLSNANQPIGGAECMIEILSTGEVLTTATLDDGRFSFPSLPGPGATVLEVDGGAATLVGGLSIPLGTFPHLEFEPVLVPHAQNSLGMPILLPKLEGSVYYSTSEPTVLTVPGIEGLRLTILPGSMSLDGGATPAPEGTQVSLSRVNHDDVPMPMPDGVAPPFAWTFQPAAASYYPPVEVEYPNMAALPPGGISNFLSFDHDTGRFEIVGTGTVSSDGSVIVSESKSGLTQGGWGCNCPPYAVATDCEDCDVMLIEPSGTYCAGRPLTVRASGPSVAGTYTWTVPDAVPSTFVEEGTGESEAVFTFASDYAGLASFSVAWEPSDPELSQSCSDSETFLVAPGDVVELRYGAFIACEIIPNPLFVNPFDEEYYGGDNRDFGWEGVVGNSRAAHGALFPLALPSPGQFFVKNSTAYDASNVVLGPQGPPGCEYVCVGSVAPGVGPDCDLPGFLDDSSVAMVADTGEDAGYIESEYSFLFSAGPGCVFAGQVVAGEISVCARLSLRQYYDIDGVLEGQFEVSGEVCHDGFPWHEFWINQTPVYTYEPCAGGNNLFDLFGDCSLGGLSCVVALESYVFEGVVIPVQ